VEAVLERVGHVVINRAPGRIARMKNRVVMAVLLAAAVVSGLVMQAGTSAYAADCVPDPDNPASCMQDGAKTWISTYGIPAVGALILVASLFFLGVKWYRKGNAQAH
jgi:hypothetical protein